MKCDGSHGWDEGLSLWIDKDTGFDFTGILTDPGNYLKGNYENIYCLGIRKEWICCPPEVANSGLQ